MWKRRALTKGSAWDVLPFPGNITLNWRVRWHGKRAFQQRCWIVKTRDWYYWAKATSQIYVLTLYSKGERETIDAATLKRIAKQLEELNSTLAICEQ